MSHCKHHQRVILNEKITVKSWIPEEDVRKQAQKAMKLGFSLKILNS